MSQQPFLKVIQVDDDVDFSSLMQLMIHSLGEFEIKQANNLTQIIERLQSDQPQILLIDITQYDFEIEQLLQHIQQNTPNLNLIILTHMSFEEVKALIQTQCQFTYINKSQPIPIIRQEMKHCLETIISNNA